MSRTPRPSRDRHACARAQEAISAQLDGEPTDLAPTVLAHHLHRCQRCRDFLAGATDLLHRIRVLEPAGIPDLSGQILSSAPPPRRHPGRRVVVAMRAAASVLRRRAAWVAAALPLVLVLSSVGAGALGSRGVVGAGAPTPCTAHLTSTGGVPGDPTGGRGPQWLVRPRRGAPDGSTASVRSRGSAHGQDSRT